MVNVPAPDRKGLMMKDGDFFEEVLTGAYKRMHLYT